MHQSWQNTKKATASWVAATCVDVWWLSTDLWFKREHRPGLSWDHTGMSTHIETGDLSEWTADWFLWWFKLNSDLWYGWESVQKDTLATCVYFCKVSFVRCLFAWFLTHMINYRLKLRQAVCIRCDVQRDWMIQIFFMCRAGDISIADILSVMSTGLFVYCFVSWFSNKI